MMMSSTPALCAGVSTMMDPEAPPGTRGSHPSLGTLKPPNVTTTAIWNPAPVILSGVPPPVEPVFGDIAVTDGAGSDEIGGVGCDGANGADGIAETPGPPQPASPVASASRKTNERILVGMAARSV